MSTCAGWGAGSGALSRVAANSSTLCDAVATRLRVCAHPVSRRHGASRRSRGRGLPLQDRSGGFAPDATPRSANGAYSLAPVFGLGRVAYRFVRLGLRCHRV